MKTDEVSLSGAKEGEQTVYKENLVVLDNENHLYHVVVKGMHVRDGKEVNTQWSTAASINAMVWKGDLLAFGDSEGRISVWDLVRSLLLFPSPPLPSAAGPGRARSSRGSRAAPPAPP